MKTTMIGAAVVLLGFGCAAGAADKIRIGGGDWCNASPSFSVSASNILKNQGFSHPRT